MKLFFGVIMAISLSLIVFKFANKYFLQKKFYDNLTNFLEYLYSNLSFHNDNAHSIFINYHNNNFDLQQIISGYANNAKNRVDIWTYLDKISYLSITDKTQIANFFNNFGTVDKDTQLNNIQSMMDWSKQKQTYSYTECLQKGKMYRTLSIMLGLAILVIYI